MNLNEMKKIADARTKGEWSHDTGDIYCRNPGSQVTIMSGCCSETGRQWSKNEDGEFIAMAANNWDKLMAVMDAVKNIEINEPAFHEALKALEESDATK